MGKCTCKECRDSGQSPKQINEEVAKFLFENMGGDFNMCVDHAKKALENKEILEAHNWLSCALYKAVKCWFDERYNVALKWFHEKAKEEDFIERLKEIAEGSEGSDK